MQYPSFFIFIFFISITFAALVNVTIDDELVTYQPTTAWKQGTTCTPCTTNLDANQTLNGTWHDGMFNPAQSSNGPLNMPLFASLSFHGSAIYVYCVLANTEFSPNGNSDMTFYIDSEPAGFFSQPPPGTPGFQYNKLVFSTESLSHGKHNLTIQNGRIGGKKSLLILDYIVYSYDLQRSSILVAAASKVDHTASAGKIIGGVLGSLGGILLVLVAFLFLRQQQVTQGLEPASPGVLRGECRRPHFITLLHRWSPKFPFRRDESPRRVSFHPSLFILPTFNFSRTRIDTHSPGVIQNPQNVDRRTIGPTHPQPNLSPPLPVMNRLSSTILRFHTHTSYRQEQPLSITEWQRRTQMEADAVPPRLDMSEVDLSSYYESDSHCHSPPPPARPPPKPTIRRFTVVNN